MALTLGERLGVYEVRELIGAGGMGEVYRAHDTRLNRSVALKILPATFALDSDRLSRFRREAQVLAALNHSNIGAIFGFEESSAVHALILELVEGPTLADRLADGPLTLDEAVLIARQIAAALEAAHMQGIIHRDLKPANIKVRPDGTVKVLDFGLAKTLAGDLVTASVTQSPTITSPALTQMGIILGTAAYMSPEQARGKAADKRSDIWAFGALLYEMLTGRRAFGGEDIPDTLANILKTEPDWTALPVGTPAPVRRVLRRCLEKDPERRVHDIADARLDLDESEPAASAALVLQPTKGRRPGVERAAWIGLVGALAATLSYVVLRDAPPGQVLRFQVHPPEAGSFGATAGTVIPDGTSGAVLSPDGTQLAFIASRKNGRAELWLRRLDSFASRPLSAPDSVSMPFWAPDGRSIGFFADGKLQRIDTGDGSIRVLANAQGIPRGATWGSLGVIVFCAGTPTRLARISSGGGEVTGIGPGGNSDARYPLFLPDGRHFVYSGRLGTSAEQGLIVSSTDAGFETRPLVPSESNAAFAPPGLLLFARGERLLQQGLDLERLEVTGEATPVVEQVLYNPGVARADFTVSATGVLAYRSGSNGSNQFGWFDRRGILQETIGPPGNYRTPDLSPDGQQLAYGDVNQRDIWIFNLLRKTSSRFTTGPGTETSPVWFPDGTKIAYRNDQAGMFEKDVSGTGTERALLTTAVNGPSQVSADGKWILYFALTPTGDRDIYVLPTTGDRKPRAIVQSPFPDVEPQLSRDGRWLAYASSESGRNQVYVQAFPSTGRRWPVSDQGGRQPLWRADGKELFFVSEDKKFYAVSVSSDSDSIDFGVPQFLFDMPANVMNSRNSYIPSRDGKRFLVNTLLETDDLPINVVYNWRAALR